MKIVPAYFTVFLLVLLGITFFYKFTLNNGPPRRHHTTLLDENSCVDLSHTIKDILLVNLNPDNHNCNTKLKDEEIVNQCKKNLLLQNRSISPLPDFKTPPPPSHTSEHHEKLQLKYQQRVMAGQCSLSKGMWRNNFNGRCTIVTMAELANYKPGDLILDHGCGCGHQATVMTMLYGVRVIGVDINGAAIRWAKKHSIGTFYYTDGFNLSWIPDNTFDHFFSFATAHLVPPPDKCRFGSEVVRILKPQGSALLGFVNSDMVFGFQPRSVWDCVGDIDGVTMSIYDDKDLYGSPDLSNPKGYSVILKINTK